MFIAERYHARRQQLAADVKSGVMLFLGNSQTPINYRDNPYPFRQDSSFLYFWGLDFPDLAAVIDIDESQEILFGDDMTLEETVWSGSHPSLHTYCEKSGIQSLKSRGSLEVFLDKCLQASRRIHFLPQYKTSNVLQLIQMLELDIDVVEDGTSPEMIRAVVAQRSIKNKDEILQIEQALDVTHEMHCVAMEMTSPGMVEMEVVSTMESLAYARGGHRMSYPTIFSVRGEILHNPFHGNIMRDGELAINDSGADSLMHYASDITRTIPVGGKFSDQQKEIYSMVLSAQETAIQAMRPGVEFREIHNLACRELTQGLQAIGLMKGDIESSVIEGAHALFMPHGLGHMIGLDVHDMESLGEDYVGYTKTIKRSDQFGARNLRLAKRLEDGYVVTVEPGIYFIPPLIDRWNSEGRFKQFIDYQKVETYIGFGGVRIEDNVLVSDNGSRVLGKPIPKSIQDVESFSSIQ